MHSMINQQYVAIIPPLMIDVSESKLVEMAMSGYSHGVRESERRD